MKPTKKRPTGQSKKPGGVTGKGFQPGQSGNPGGRPKGLSTYVRQTCGDDGHQLVDRLRAIAYGSAAERRQLFGEAIHVNTRERTAALTELLNRGWGRPMMVAVATDPPAPVIVRFVDAFADEQ